MFNEGLIKAYYRTREKEFLLKREMLLLNNKNISYTAEERKELILKSFNNLKLQDKIKNRLDFHNLLNLIEYWEKVGFFDQELETKISIDELLALSKKWFNNFYAIIDLAIMLCKNNPQVKETLLIDEESLLIHKTKYPHYYMNNKAITLDAIIRSSCFQQISLSTTHMNFKSIKEQHNLEIFSMQTEIEFALKNFKKQIPENKKGLFIDILYKLSLVTQNKAINKLNNLITESDEDYAIVLNLSNSLNQTLYHLKTNENVLKNTILKELNNI